MKPFTIISIVAGWLAMLLAPANMHGQVSFPGPELLGRPTDHSVTINVVANAAIQAYFEYGTLSGVYTQTNPASGAAGPVSAAANVPLVVVLSGLSPNTQYFYRMVYRKTSTSSWNTRAEHSFYTQRPPGSAFTFTVGADSHINIVFGNASLYRQTLQNVAGENPDFHLDLGDTFAMDSVTTQAQANTSYLNLRSYFGLISPSVPIFLALGNHEQEEGWHLDDTGNAATSPPVMSTNARKRYYLNPDPLLDSFYTGNTDTTVSAISDNHAIQDYYAWQWGDALFVVIDPYWYTTTKPYIGNTGGGESSDPGSGDRWDWTLGISQYLWLRQTLESSNAKYKFIFAHQVAGGTDDYGRGGANAVPYVEWGGYDDDGTTPGFTTLRPGWDAPVHQLLVNNNVTAFFHGHDHEFAYEKRDGVVYQLVPMAADATYGYGFQDYHETDPYTVRVLPNSGHLRVTVSPSQVTVDYVRAFLSGAGTNGQVAYTYTIAPQQTTPDFSVSATPGSQTVVQGNPASYTAAVEALNGFSAAVSLGVTGLPSGAGWSFSPASVTGSGSSTLNVTTSSTTPAGTYTLTITGSSGSLNHTATVALVVSLPPDFSLSATPGSRTVAPSNSTSYTLTVGPLYGFTGQVTLSVNGLPTGANGSLSPNPATSTSTFSVTTAASTLAGTYVLTINGVSGTLTHATTVTLVVTAPVVATPTFSPGAGTYSSAQSVIISSATSGATICYTTDGSNPAATTPSTCSSGTTLANGGMVPVSVSETLKAIGTTSGYSNSPVASAVYAVYCTTNTTQIGPYTVCGTASNGGNGSSITTTYSPFQGNGVFLLLSYCAGGGTTGCDTIPTQSVASITDQTGTSLACFVPSPSSPFRLMSGPGLDAEAYYLYYCPNIPANVSAIRANLNTSAVSLHFSVVEFRSGAIATSNFWDTDNSAVSTTTGLSASVSAVSANPNDLIIAFLHNGAPTFPPGGYPPVTPDPNYTAISLPNYASNVALEGRSVSSAGSQTATASWSSTSLQWFGVIAPLRAAGSASDFTLSASPSSQAVAPGNPTSYNLTINPTNGFAGQVTLSVSGLPTGAGGSFNADPATSTSTLSVTTDAALTPAGSFTLTINGVSGSLTHTATVTLVVTAPDFTLTGSPASQTVIPGSPTSYTATVTPMNGFAGQVTLSVSGLPPGANGSFSPNPATSASILSLTTDPVITPPGTYTLTVTGVSGSLTHNATVTLVVNPAPDFTLTGSPASQTVVQGGATSYTATVTAKNGFTGQVTLSVSGLPTATVGSFSPNPATSTSTLSVTTAASTPVGTYTLTITGVSGSLTRTATATLVVTAPDFTISATPATQSVGQGRSTTYSVKITPTNGFTGQVTQSVSGLPTGATGTFSPNPATATSTLTVTTSSTTPLATSTLTITGVSGALTHTTTVSLTVTRAGVAYDNKVSAGFDFGVTNLVTPAFTIGSGTNRAAMITVAMTANKATNITASLGGVPATLIPGTDSGTTATGRTMIFQVINPPSGSQKATVSWTGSMAADVGVITVTGADQTTPTNNGGFSASNSAPAATMSLTITSNAGDLTSSIGYTADMWVSPFTNQTLKWGVDAGVAGGDVGPGTGTTTHTWKDAYSGQTLAVSGANFKAAP